MPDIVFTYCPKKYRRTFRKHGIDFEKVKCLFYYGPSQVVLAHDDKHSIYEEQLMIIGYVPDNNRFVRVNYVVREGGAIRLITAWKASKKEVKFYFRDHR